MDASRVGNFTSSEISALMSVSTDKVSPGAPFKTYVEECNMERRLQMPLEKEVSTFDMAWGKLCEKFAFDLLGIEYQECSTVTLVHPRYSFWLGTPDGRKYDEGSTVADTKCPGTRKSFCQLVDSIMASGTPEQIWERIKKNHKSGNVYFWQIVSNAILTDSKYGELVVVMPYKSQLPLIREMANNWDGDDQWQYKKIFDSEDESLPYLNDGGYYKNINVLRWEIKQSDKDALTERVLMASKLLVEYK